MKKLGDCLTPQMRARLDEIGRQVARNEAEDPRRYTYACPDCSDTGFTISDDKKHPQLGSGYVIGRPCPHCTQGQAIQRKVDLVRAARVRPKRPRNMRVVEDEPPF